MEVKDLAYDFHQLVVNGAHPMVLIMDKTYGIQIDAKVPASGYITDVKIDGSPESVLLAEYYNKAIPLQMQLQNATSRKDLASANAIREQLQAHAENWAQPRAHLACAVGAIEHLDPEKHQALMVAIMNANRAKMGNQEYFKYLENNVVNKPKPRKVATPPPAGAGNGAALGPGDAAPDIFIQIAQDRGVIRLGTETHCGNRPIRSGQAGGRGQVGPRTGFKFTS